MNKTLWTPDPDFIEDTNINRFQQYIKHSYGIDSKSYSSLYKWSIESRSDFWESIWNFCNIKYSQTFESVLIDNDHMINTSWFKGAKLNFAENLLKHKNNDIAIYSYKEDAFTEELTFNELYQQVARVSYSLKKIGIRTGD